MSQIKAIKILFINIMKQIFTCYWGGYFKNIKEYPQTLDMIPEFVDIVILAFVGPIQNSTVETTFLCSIYSAEQIKEWINICHSKNIKVFFSILDTPETHWDQIDLTKFAKSLKVLMDDWNIDGIDIDAESDMPSECYVEKFIELATCIKNEIKTLPLTYTCYTGTEGPDGEILKAIKDKLEWIQLMAYFDTFEGMVDLYNDYKTIMSDDIVIGVKAGSDITPIEEVAKLCLWNKNKKGIMLWTINRDTPQYTYNKLLLWTNTINFNLKNFTFLNISNYIKNIFCIDLFTCINSCLPIKYN